MKIGAENKKEVAIMTVLLAVLLVVGVYNFRDFLWGSSAAETPSLPVSAPQQKGPGTVAAAQDTEPSLRLDILDASRAVKYEPGNRNPFAYAPVQIPPVKESVRTGELVDRPQPDAPPPPPPKIPLVFYGFANKPGEAKRVFLAPDDRNSDRTYVAGLNEIVDRRYKIVQIQANQVVVQDMLNNNQQSIPLTPRP